MRCDSRDDVAALAKRRAARVARADAAVALSQARREAGELRVDADQAAVATMRSKSKVGNGLPPPVTQPFAP